MALFTAQSLIISNLFLGVAQAETNSTSSNTTMVGWVSPAPRRSTWGIIWSCLSIFIVCSWKCVHLNIPTHEEIQGEWHTLQICSCLPDISFWPKAPLRRKWRRKIIWMTVIALVPEFGVALAARQYLEARRELKEFTKALSPEVAQGYAMAHAFYVQMGGVVIYGPAAHQSSTMDEDSATSIQPGNEVSHDGDHTGYHALGASQESSPTVDGSLTAYMAGSLSDMQPDMFRTSESEIKDLSKADVITKAFAIIQCTWLIVQSICRVAQGYTISLLELATLAFIFCAFIMHIFWWNKPFDVESRRIVTAVGPDIKIPAKFSTLSMDDLTVSNNELLRVRVRDASIEIIDDMADPLIAILFDTASATSGEYFPALLLYITSTAFIAIHLSAWNWEFPSTVVRSLWRWFNVGTFATSLTPLLLSVLITFQPQEGTLELLHRIIGTSILFIAGFAYVVSRLVVLGLTFYCLSSMPERAYASLDWLAWVPHFS